MIKKELLIMSPYADIKKGDTVPMHGRTRIWLYFGTDPALLSSLEKRLTGDYEMMDVIELHKKTADDIRADYVKWIDELNKRNEDGIEWWMGTVFSKNNYSSDLFQYSCYMEILDRLLTEQKIVPDIIFAESFALADTIRRWAAGKDIIVTVEDGSFAVIRIKRIGKTLLDWNRFIVLSLLCWAAAFISKIRCQTKNMISGECIIIHTFLHDYSLSKEGVYIDRYFPFLYEYATNKGFKILVHPVLYGFKYPYSSIYARMRKSNTPIIIKEDFLRLSDYLYALTYPIRSLKKKVDLINFRGFDLSHIVKEARFEECFSAGMNALLMHRLLSRLKKTGINPSLLILWYENQVFDKALIAGIRRHFPKTKIIGAQLFLHLPNLLSLYPTQSEVDYNISPDVLVEMSEYQCRIATAFTRAIPCKVGAALRYSHVFKDSQHSQLKSDGEKEIIILAALPFYLPASVEMLILLKNALDYMKHKATILIRIHPDYTPRMLIKKFGKLKWPESFRFHNGKLSDVFEKVSVVVSTNTSSIVEAATYGIPVVYAGSKIMMNQNILKDLNMEIAQECYTASELADALDRYIGLHKSRKAEYKEMGRKIRDQYFTPVSEETLAPFLDVHKLYTR